MKRKAQNVKRKTLPQSTTWLFPEYDFANVNPRRDRDVIMERILERGTWSEVNWLFDYYGERDVRDWVRQRGYRALTRRSFALWRLMLNIRRFRLPPWGASDKMGPW